MTIIAQTPAQGSGDTKHLEITEELSESLANDLLIVWTQGAMPSVMALRSVMM